MQQVKLQPRVSWGFIPAASIHTGTLTQVEILLAAHGDGLIVRLRHDGATWMQQRRYGRGAMAEALQRRSARTIVNIWKRV